MRATRSMPPIVKWMCLCTCAFIALPTSVWLPVIVLASMIAVGVSLNRAARGRRCPDCGGVLNREENARCSDCGAYEFGMSSLIARAKTSNPTAMF